jgi:hypothetical protein
MICSAIPRLKERYFIDLRLAYLPTADCLIVTETRDGMETILEEVYRSLGSVLEHRPIVALTLDGLRAIADETGNREVIVANPCGGLPIDRFFIERGCKS